MTIYPAIDIRGGNVVRLIQGDFSRESVFGSDPAAQAALFAEKGATALHVVDLDGAKRGSPVNTDAIGRLIAAFPGAVQIGGGVRGRESVDRYLSLGAARVILGTAALEDFELTRELIRAYGGSIAVGVDARGGVALGNGWLTGDGQDAFLLCSRLADIGLKTLIYTDISRDGLMGGPNFSAYAELGALPCDVIASGGVSSAGDVRRLAQTNISGVIIGRAIYDGAIKLEEVLELC